MEAGTACAPGRRDWSVLTGEVVIPNQTFFTSSFTTYTGTNRNIRLLIPIGASYNSDPEEVIKILEALCQSQPEIKRHPKPTAFLSDFGDSSVNFNLAIWINNPIRIASITSNINRAIWKAFAENNIEIPYPQQDIHLHGNGPDQEGEGVADDNSVASLD